MWLGYYVGRVYNIGITHLNLKCKYKILFLTFEARSVSKSQILFCFVFQKVMTIVFGVSHHQLPQ